MGDMSPFLRVENLSHRASNGQSLLDSVSFDLARGSVLAIAGPNGAGKTTLLNLMAGLAAATSGKIFVDGQNLDSLNASTRSRIMAVVGQQSAADARLSLREYVALGQLPLWRDRSAQEHEAHLDRILNMTGLLTLAHKFMGQLSGGEKQRAHIARALVQKPQLLFLDEPTNHLDPDAKGRVLSLVGALGITVVMVIHDVVMIPEFATHIALMKDTRLTAFGPVSDVQTPDAIFETFGVEYRLFHEPERSIPALDIRKTNIPKAGETL